MSAQEIFRKVWDSEFRTTVNVFRSFLPEHLDLKPHERSRTVRDLAWQCVIDERVMGAVLEKTGHDLRNAPPGQPPPENMDEIVSAYSRAHEAGARDLGSLTEDEFGRTVTSILKFGEWKAPKPEVLWSNVLDQGHHRGQLTVYLRQAGGKVPPIYGPSGDEPVSRR